MALVFTDDQNEADRLITDWLNTNRRCFTLGGAAGTGKTTLMAHTIVKERARGVIYLAPTHRAVAVMKERLAEHGLAHSCFTYAKGTNRVLAKDDVRCYLVKLDRPNDLMENAALVVVDEASWIDDDTWDVLIREGEQYNVKYLFVGDQYQLPPVAAKPTWPAFQLVDDQFTLEEVVRQAVDSVIIGNSIILVSDISSGARRVRRLFQGERNGHGVYRIDRDDIVRHFVAYAKVNSSKNIRILAWRNRVVQDHSDAIRQQLYGAPPGSPWVVGEPVINSGQVVGKGGDYLYANQESRVHTVSEKEVRHFMYKSIYFRPIVLQPEDGSGLFVTREVLNAGELDKVLKEIRKEAHAHEPGTEGWRRNWRKFWSLKEQFVELTSAYVSTVHSAQGTTLDAVWLDVEDIMASRHKNGAEFANRMLYVAVTRAATSAFIAEDLT